MASPIGGPEADPAGRGQASRGDVGAKDGAKDTVRAPTDGDNPASEATGPRRETGAPGCAAALPTSRAGPAVTSSRHAGHQQLARGTGRDDAMTRGRAASGEARPHHLDESRTRDSAGSWAPRNLGRAPTLAAASQHAVGWQSRSFGPSLQLQQPGRALVGAGQPWAGASDPTAYGGAPFGPEAHFGTSGGPMVWQGLAADARWGAPTPAAALEWQLGPPMQASSQFESSAALGLGRGAEGAHGGLAADAGAWNATRAHLPAPPQGPAAWMHPFAQLGMPVAVARGGGGWASAVGRRPPASAANAFPRGRETASHGTATCSSRHLPAALQSSWPPAAHMPPYLGSAPSTCTPSHHDGVICTPVVSPQGGSAGRSLASTPNASAAAFHLGHAAQSSAPAAASPSGRGVRDHDVATASRAFRGRASGGPCGETRSGQPKEAAEQAPAGRPAKRPRDSTADEHSWQWPRLHAPSAAAAARVPEFGDFSMSSSRLTIASSASLGPRGAGPSQRAGDAWAVLRCPEAEVSGAGTGGAAAGRDTTASATAALSGQTPRFQAILLPPSSTGAKWPYKPASS